MQDREHPEKSNATRRHLAMFKARNRRIASLAVGLCALVLVAALVIIAVTTLRQEEQDDGRILSNVFVAGVDLGGMDRAEAESALRLAIGDTLTTQSMVVTLPDDQLVLTPESTGAYVDIDEVLDAALAYGRDGSKAENRRIRKTAADRKYVIALLDYMDLDSAYIADAVDAFCQQYSSVMVESSDFISGVRPDYREILASGGSPSSARHQTLTITIGTPQFYLESEELYATILDAYSMLQMNFSYDTPIAEKPDMPDAQALFDKYCTLAVDASIDPDTFVVEPEVYGYGFDVTELARMINRADYGDTITITLNFLYPVITEEDLTVNFFQDTLATYISTNSTHHANRNKNLELACEAINGLIIKPGDSFNFNQALGPRTEGTGYKSAPSYAGSNTNIIGGGVGQVASALRYCAMMAGLQIQEYHLHTYAVPYTPYGTDASVTDGNNNLIFVNTSADPIQLFASHEDGSVIISIMGTDDRDYRISLQSEVLMVLSPDVEYQYMSPDNVYSYEDGQILQDPITGYIVELYEVRYDAETGEELSRTLLSVITYSRRNQIIVRIDNSESEIDPQLEPD